MVLLRDPLRCAACLSQQHSHPVCLNLWNGWFSRPNRPTAGTHVMNKKSPITAGSRLGWMSGKDPKQPACQAPFTSERWHSHMRSMQQVQGQALATHAAQSAQAAEAAAGVATAAAAAVAASGGMQGGRGGRMGRGPPMGRGMPGRGR